MRDIYLGEWLRYADIGPTEAAAVAGCSQSYISNIARGAKPNINVLYLLRLSEHIGITVNDFFHRPPSQSQVAAIAELSPQAQNFILSRTAQRG